VSTVTPPATVIDALATPEPPHLGFAPRPGILPAAEVTARVEAWCAARAVPAARRPLLLALGLLYHDHEAAAHQLCQEREGQADADLIHAILHRREGDAANAGYWWSAVGAHPVFPALAAAARRHGVPAGGDAFDPRAVVAALLAGDDAPRLRAWQDEEFRLVAAHLAG
jgi:hypothetical protein